MADCPQCAQIVLVGGDIRALAREAGKINTLLAPLTKQYERLQRGHPRCAACGVLIGERHHEQSLTPEPMRPRARGQLRYDVCSECFRRLHGAHRSVPQQRAYELEQSDLLGEEAEEAV